MSNIKNIINIIKCNKNTFYNNNRNINDTLFNIYWKQTVITFILTFLFHKIDKDLIEIILTTYSILIGFSFNVLFYILSISKMKYEENVSPEKQLKIDRINKLTNEIFYNISYFNIISILVILLCLYYFLLTCMIKIGTYQIIGLITQIHDYIWKIFFYFFVTESIYSFIRIIGRISYYFEQKIKLQNDS